MILIRIGYLWQVKFRKDQSWVQFLFVIFINDLPDVISKKNICKIYADGTKILSIVNSLAAQLQLQSDIDQFVHCTRSWLMELNAKKCKVMHFGEK